ncbi:MAG: putative O-acyltransferase, transrane [Chthonomonadaceae bacterium]|nr:putative O-acyltransferase, transrane [Chthonomonadaceae bacterium]
MTEVCEKPKRFYSLDVLRGIAALCVVLWHWQHFFLFNARQEDFSLTRQPLYSLLFAAYTHGGTAVDLFFCLSGFVFYWLYAKPIAAKTIAIRDFFVLRFSRLYPLQFVTLLFVAIGQYAFHRQTGAYFIYPINDVRHFILNLFFLQASGLQRGASFNFPTWSVSIEILLYLLFFVLCRILPVRIPTLLCMIALGFAIEKHGGISRGLVSFFLGGCIYLIYDWVVRSGGVRRVSTWLPILTGGLWIWTLIALKMGLSPLPLVSAYLPRYTPKGLFLIDEWMILVLFPLSILSLALLETLRGTLGKRIAFVGELTYSSYLLHFPLQMMTMGIVLTFSIDRSLFYSPVALFAFMGVLVLLSFACYRYFELPAQKSLRKRFLSRKT